MNLSKLTTLELRVLAGLISPYEYPHLTNLIALKKEIIAACKVSSDYVKGKMYEEIAIGHGIEDGYAEPEDYYFAIHTHEVDGKVYSSVILCFKFQWWMNGQDFNPTKDGQKGRNFDVKVPKKYKKLIDEDSYDDPYEDIELAPEIVRQWFLDSGYEEKVELLPIYEKYVAAAHAKRRYYDEDDE